MKSYIPALIIGLALVQGAHGDQRSFVWTYQYQTLQPGDAEVEAYSTYSTPFADSISGTMSVEHQLELEVGMTPRFDFSIYQVFGQSPGASLKYKAFKLRSRYRLGDIEGDWLRPILYFEYKSNQDFTEQKLEFKPIVGKNHGNLLLALNPKLEWEKKTEAEWLWGYAVAAGYRLNDDLAIGLELTGSESGHYLGPTIAHGKHDLWVAFGSGFALGSVDAGKPEMQYRLLLGIGLGE